LTTPAPTQRRLAPSGKAVYALGDFTVNTVLASLSLVYASFYLTQVAGMRGALAGLVPLIARAVDAFTDPLMGRISDETRWAGGRRRPYFLLGAIPFGVSFALLWWDVPLESQAAKFAYYTAVYSLLSIAMTVLSVPYLALIPEMAEDYDERTSLNTYRNVGSTLGIFAAIGIRPLAEAMGGGGAGFALAGALLGLVLTVPWIFVHRVSFERPDFQRTVDGMGFIDGLRALARHRTFVQLTGLYLVGRVAFDLVGALMILYMTFWIGRSGDFEPVMFLFLVSVVAALPVWLRIARHYEKSTIFIFGSLWWAGFQVLTLFFGPATPFWAMFVYAPLAAIGFAVVDLMPWSMVGEVVDEDDLLHGERREGLYNGVFTFLRKLAGAVGVFMVLAVLDLAGLTQAPEQSETVRQTIRFMNGLLPAVCLLVGAFLARGYPLTRSAHAEITRQLAARPRRG